MTTTQPLMPKATAVWLVDNTALSFEQIADFCKLHPLEVRSIADGALLTESKTASARAAIMPPRVPCLFMVCM